MGNFCSCIGMGAQLPFPDKTSSKALYFHVFGQQALSEVGEGVVDRDWTGIWVGWGSSHSP